MKQGADGVPVAEICREAGIGHATYFNWKRKFEGMTPPETRQLKQLEDENAKLRKLVADLSLDREMLQDVTFVSKKFIRINLTARLGSFSAGEENLEQPQAAYVE